MKKVILSIGALVLIGLVLFGLIQLIPVNTTNPPVVTQVTWDSPQTEALFKRACADCHSNETVWPWYSHIAPVSWLNAHDVSEGRSRFNISALNTSSREFNRLATEIERQVTEGEMPMAIYLPMHPQAKLSPAETQALIAGLKATLANVK